MSCNCDCNRILKTTAIEVAGDVLELVVPDTELIHGRKYRICFAQNPPVTTKALKVEIAVNEVKIPVTQTRMVGAYGALSLLYSDQLQRNCSGQIRARQYIDVVYGADTVTFNYVSPCGCLPRANVEFPRLPIPTPPAAPPKKNKKEDE